MTRSDASGDDVRNVVAKRHDVLAALAADRWRKPALVTELDASRSTIDRAVDDLTGTGLVERTDGTYAATGTGRLALDAYRDYAALTDDIAAASALVAATPPDEPLDSTLISDADVQLAEPRVPESALTEAVETLSEVDTVRGFAPVIKSSYASLLREEVTERNLSVEMIVERSARRSLASVADAREELAALLAAEEVTVLETDADLPYALWLMTGSTVERAGVTVHDSGGIVGVLTNDSADAVEWCSQRYESVRADADPLPVDELTE